MKSTTQPEELHQSLQSIYCHQSPNNMHNITNMSFFYVTNPIPFYTYVPVTTVFSDGCTSTSEQPLTPTTPSTFLAHPDSFFHPQSCYSGLQDNHHQRTSIQAIKSEHCLTESLVKEAEEVGQGLGLEGGMRWAREKGRETVKREEQSLGEVLRNPQQKFNRGQKKVSKRKTDQDYLPQLERNRKYTLKYQVNENRNVVPNQINQIFSFVQKQNKSGHLVNKLFQKYPHPQQYTLKRFYLYQALLKNRLGHYSNEKSLKVVTELYEPKCENWSEQEQRYYNKICRILIHHFLHEDSIFIILTSKRMKKEKKSDHLRARRQIAQSVGNILKGF